MAGNPVQRANLAYDAKCAGGAYGLQNPDGESLILVQLAPLALMAIRYPLVSIVYEALVL